MALMVGSIVGAGLAFKVSIGLALLIGLCYVPIALSDLRLALAVWVPLPFFAAVSSLNAAGKAAGLVVGALWLWSWCLRRRRTGVFVWPVGPICFLLVMVVWFTLTVIWAVSVRTAAGDLWHWYVLALLYLVIVTVAHDERSLRTVVGAYIAGGVLTVLLARLSGGLTANKQVELSASAAAAAAARLRGGIGDPNFLAAALLAATVLALGLWPSVRRSRSRWLLVVAIAVMVVGFAKAESRGGMVGVAATLPLAFFVLPGHRRRLALLAVVICCSAAIYLALSPSTWHSITANNRGDGRTDLWKVALHISAAHPVTGVGISNYQVVAPTYVDRVGSLQNVNIIAANPHETHNAYIQTLAETGIPGLCLYGLFCLACLQASWLASKRFRERGDLRQATMAGAVLLAQFSMLVTSVFLSAQEDQRMWIILALGPAMWSASRSTESWVATPDPAGALVEAPSAAL